MSIPTIVKIHERLRSKGWTCAVAESLTAGRVQSLLSSISGSSDVFEGGVSVYSVAQKVTHLAVDADVAAACEGVCEQTAREMAAGVCKMFGCECGVGTTGFAEPFGDVRRPFAWIAVCVDGEVNAFRFECDGSRNEVQQAVAETAVSRFAEALGVVGNDGL